MFREAFISSIREAAIEEMLEYRFFASVKIAQAILESSWGRSRLAVEANNLYGIKGTGPAGSITLPTREFSEQRGWHEITTAFRRYHSVEESVRDHTQFLLRNNRYVQVFRASTPQQASIELQRAGYATDPNYADKLNRLIRDHSLELIDQEAERRQQVKGISTEDLNLTRIEPLPYAEEAWNWAISHNVTDGSLPGRPARREEMAAFIHRLLKQV